MRLNRKIIEIEQHVPMLSMAEYEKYFAFEEHRSKRATLLIQIMAFMACAASWMCRPTPMSDLRGELVLALMTMAISAVITYCTRSFWLGAVGRTLFVLFCSQYFLIISSESPNTLFWHMSIGSAILIAMSPLHYEPVSYSTTGFVIIFRLLEYHYGGLLSNSERDWIIALMVSAFFFGALMNVRFFLARTRIYKVNRQLAELAFKDSLTKINNRRAILGEWEHWIAKHPGDEINFLLIDVDNFKSINDEHGHDVGDDVLREIAMVLESTNGVKICGRLGGEEFAAVHRGSLKEAAQLAGEINRRIAATTVRELRFTVSVGVTSHLPGESISVVTKRADDALYEAKRKGKNTFSVQPAPNVTSDQFVGDTI